MLTADVTLSASAQLVRAEYLEMPGLSLTKRQIQRLWSLDAPRCEVLLDALVSVRFLKQTRGDAYVRADVGA